MEILFYISCALVILLLIYFVFPRIGNGNVIPGPQGLPVIGCLFEFSLKTMHTKCMEYAEKYGDIVRINILGINIITLNTVDLVQKAFTEERYKTHLNDRPSTFFGKYVFYDSFITTFSTLSNLFLCLMNRPNYQRKAQEELNRVVGNERLPTIDDRRNCPFIEALVMETLRYLTTVPLGGHHATRRSLQFEGFQIPANSTVLANLWFIHHDERICGDPWTFRPERFLNDKGQLLERGHVFRKSLIPFGVGRRQCIGEKFARSRLFLYTASLLQQWTFVPSPGKVGTSDPRKGDFKINALIRKESLFCTVEDAETGG